MSKKKKNKAKPVKKSRGKRKSKKVRVNPVDLPAADIVAQMNEPRPLPMGRAAFDYWSDRIISGALLPVGPTDNSPEVFIDSQRFALANMLMHLGPTESHKPDAYFIHSLRKFAVNQVADAVRKELHEAAKARTAAKENEEKTLNGKYAMTPIEEVGAHNIS